MITAQANSGSSDSLNMAGVKIQSVYTVGINLEDALKNPGSDADIVLRDGDVISVPMYNGTVRVMGAVLYPNSVTFTEGKKLKYYVDAAGGFDNRARKNERNGRIGQVGRDTSGMYRDSPVEEPDESHIMGRGCRSAVVYGIDRSRDNIGA